MTSAISHVLTRSCDTSTMEGRHELPGRMQAEMRLDYAQTAWRAKIVEAENPTTNNTYKFVLTLLAVLTTDPLREHFTEDVEIAMNKWMRAGFEEYLVKRPRIIIGKDKSPDIEENHTMTRKRDEHR